MDKNSPLSSSVSSTGSSKNEFGSNGKFSYLHCRNHVYYSNHININMYHCLVLLLFLLLSPSQNDKWSTNRQYSFLTDSFAKKDKQANKQTHTKSTKQTCKKKTNKQYLPVSYTTTSEISEHKKYIYTYMGYLCSYLFCSVNHTYIYIYIFTYPRSAQFIKYTEKNSNAKDETYFPSFAIVKD